MKKGSVLFVFLLFSLFLRLDAQWRLMIENAAFSPRDTAEPFIFADKMWLSNGYTLGGEGVRDLWNSTDGVNWTKVLDATPYDPYAEIAVYDGKIWAVRNSVWQSTDGTTWTQVLANTPFGARAYGELVVFDGKLWQLGSGADVWWTTDGRNWTCATNTAPYGDRFGSAVAAFAGKLWLIAGATEGANEPPEYGYSMFTTYNDVWCSIDGANWTRVVENAPFEQRIWVAAQVCGGKLMVCCGFSNRRGTNLGDIWYTDNGVSWNALDTETKFSPRHEVSTYDFMGDLWIMAGNAWPIMNDVWKFEFPDIYLSAVTTAATTNITNTAAVSGGNVTSDGGAPVTDRGVCVSTSANPTILNNHTHDGAGVGSFTSSLTSATPGTTYHVRAYATNSVGTAYGEDLTFATFPAMPWVPTVTTTPASSITVTSALTGGTVTSDNGEAVTDRGVCVSTVANPTTADPHTDDGSGIGSFTSRLTGATPLSTYHVRAYATNSVGTAYGNDVWFKTPGGSKNDFNGDGYEDILWRNLSTGENYLWFLGPADAASAGLLTIDTGTLFSGVAPPQDYRAVQGFFEGQPAKSYRSPQEGMKLPDQKGSSPSPVIASGGISSAGECQSPNAPFLGVAIQSLTQTGGAAVPSMTDFNWKIVGTGDFNGDGRPDIVWRNYANGDNGVWYMSGGTQLGAEYMLSVTDMTWEIVGTGDFNGDGMVDIVWRNAVSGENYVWYMNGVTRIGGDALVTVTDLSWEIVGTGDFNGDGKVDLLWRNSVTGEEYIWYMNGVTRIGGESAPQVKNLDWKIAGAGDFNGDGKSDILWRNYVTGENLVWYMDGGTQLGIENLILVTDLTWHIMNR